MSNIDSVITVTTDLSFTVMTCNNDPSLQLQHVTMM